MQTTTRPTIEKLIRTYFHAKDENRPHLMRQVFAEDACLKMYVKSDAISFPPVSNGLVDIADALVSKFNQKYENIYSFCLQRPLADTCLDRYTCDWLVVMTEKGSGNVRVGCGSYDWVMQSEAPFLVEKLEIAIDVMQVLPSEVQHLIFDWVSALPYPWVTLEDMRSTLPNVDGLAVVLSHLNLNAITCNNNGANSIS